MVYIFLVTMGFVVLDFVTGLIKAFYREEFTSTVMRKGIISKAGCLAVLLLTILIDYAQTLVDIGFEVPLASSVCVYFIIMEIGSIIENIGAINSDLIPTVLRKHFKKLNLLDLELGKPIIEVETEETQEHIKED